MPVLEPVSIEQNPKSGSDTWYGVQDARSRKLIQDRLAQRARRKRLAESKPKPKVNEPNHGGLRIGRLAPKVPQSLWSISESAQLDGVVTRALLGQPNCSIDLHLPALETSSLEAAEIIPYSRPQPTWPTSGPATFNPGTDPYFHNMPILTVFAALHNNSRILGISCLYPLPRQSPPGSPDLPAALHPVSLQMEVHHLPYIDCLPLPKLRHNLILFNGLVDDEMFCFDLTTSSNFIAAGSQSWEPKDWVISPEFKERWAVLFN